MHKNSRGTEASGIFCAYAVKIAENSIIFNKIRLNSTFFCKELAHSSVLLFALPWGLSLEWENGDFDIS